MTAARATPAGQRWAHVLLWILPALWSSNYIIARAANGVVAPHVLAIGRWSVAFALMLPFVGRAVISAWPFASRLRPGTLTTSARSQAAAFTPHSSRLAPPTSATTLSSVCAQLASAFGAAVGTLLLALSQIAHGRDALGAADFRVAFVCIGLIALASLGGFARLRPGDGAEVSGHRRPARAA